MTRLGRSLGTRSSLLPSPAADRPRVAASVVQADVRFDHRERMAHEPDVERRERQALERSFNQFHFKVGKRTWKRSDLYARS